MITIIDAHDGCPSVRALRSMFEHLGVLLCRVRRGSQQLQCAFDQVSTMFETTLQRVELRTERGGVHCDAYRGVDGPDGAGVGRPALSVHD
jgi:hypothetical protein